MHSVLRNILETTKNQLNRDTAYRSAIERRLDGMSAPSDFAASLKEPGRRIIAEVKRTSPSEGELRTGVVPKNIASSYQASGAAAISVLTEPSYFHGSLEDLEVVSSQVAIPCLRKDFIVDEIQILEARAAGASAFLLIVAALDEHELATLLSFGQGLDLTPLVEVHTEEELKRAEQAGASIIGVNNRNLNTLHIDLEVSQRLRRFIPEHVTAVAESGIRTPNDLRTLEKAGYHSFLIGSSLMKASDPGRQLRDLIECPNL